MKLAFVVQRYGESVAGGAETLCRRVAERLARHHEVEVLTTRALDYVTWRNELPPGLERIGGLPVRRFSVSRERRPRRFGLLQEFVLHCPHQARDERAWLREEGPYSPALVRFLRRRRDYDLIFFFCFRYWTTFHGLRAVPERAVLVPTAEQDEIIRLAIFRDLFRLPRAIVYLTPEERSLVQSVSGNEHVPSAVIGGLDELPLRGDAELFRRRHGLRGDYLLYLGRVDENKGCREMFSHFLRYVGERGGGLELVLAGQPVMEIPSHPAIRPLGFLPPEEKAAALAGCLFLLMPSPYESLSMVLLEAWSLGRPVLVNGRCDVLRGQVLRSGGGLFYETYEEFLFTAELLRSNAGLRQCLGRSGEAYCLQHYDWRLIEERYRELIARIAAGASAPGGGDSAVGPGTTGG